MSRPTSPGITRRTGITSQLVIARMNCPAGLWNGTRSHWKWKRASSRQTKKPKTVSIRKTVIWVSTSVLASHFPPHLLAAPAGGLHRAHEALGELLLREHVERRRGGPAFGGDVLPQLGRIFFRRKSELGRPQHRVLGELHGVVLRNAELHRRGGELLDEPEDVGRPARRHGGDRVEQALLGQPDDLADRAQNAFRFLLFGRAYF